MRRSYIFARRITAGKSGSPIGWDGLDDFVSWYAKNQSTTSPKALLKLFYKNDVTRTGGVMNGLILEVEGKALTDIYNVRGANISVYLPSNADVTGAGINVGLHVEMQGGTNIGGSWYGAYIYSAPGGLPAGGGAVLRLESGVSADNRNPIWLEFQGGKGQYAMTFGSLSTQTAWAYQGAPSDQAGWIKIKVGAFDRWITLYGTAP